MDKYIINKDTLYLKSIEKEKTLIIENDLEIVVDQSLKDIVNTSCLFFGCSLQGRIEGTKYLLNYSYKLPIVIDDINNLVFFPNISYTSTECNWISYNNIKEYKKVGKTTKVIFNSNKEFDIDTTISSFENQYFRAMRLFNIIMKKGQ